MRKPDLIFPAGLPAGISVVITTRVGGVSRGVYAGLNLATHVDDNPASVQANRDLLVSQLGLEQAPVWLEQVHGKAIIEAAANSALEQADGSITEERGLPLAIMTADCLPIVMWDSSRSRVCALHAGWRGLASGIIAAGAKLFRGKFSAFIGPGIGPCHYEIDQTVREQFRSDVAFSPSRSNHYRFDLALEARRQLFAAGAENVQGMSVCTACDERFYSYRRDGQTGRFATLVWLT
jgi:YfiH family protein